MMCANKSSRQLRDKLAVILSMFCILQCLFMPVLITMLPLLDIWWLSDDFLHPVMLFLVIPLTVIALVPGYFNHRDFRPLLIAVPALLLLIIGAFIEESMVEKLLTIGGAIILAVAHLLNMGLNRKVTHHSTVSIA